MPGLLLANSLSQKLFETHAASVLHDNRYRLNTVYSFQDFRLAATTYEGYPLEVHHFGDFDLLFEGMAYHQNNAERQADFQRFFDGNQLSVKGIKNWVERADGSFILLIISRLTNEVYLLNDQWGRLPVYFWSDGEKLVLAREMAFVRLMSEQTDFCRFGAAENLLFGFPLGTRSIWQNISRLKAASVLRLDLKTSKWTLEGNFQAFETPAATKPDPEKLIQLFAGAVHDRLKQMPSAVLSLSGGLDSRLIAAVLAKENLPIKSLTYTLADDATNRDRLSVEAMVERLNLSGQHQFYELHAADQLDEVIQLLNAKQGMNYAGMAFLLPFLRHFAANNFSMLTGDGGDKLLADLRPLIPLKSEKQLLRYIIQNHHTTPFHLVCKWMGISEKVFENHLLDHLETYGLSDTSAQYSQFLLRERAFKWLFEGEDRNRIFSWTETPFYQPLFAVEALSIAMDDKAFGRLFAQMFVRLPGRLHEVVNPNWQLPLTAEAAIKQLFWRQRLKQKWPFLQAMTSSGRVNAWENFRYASQILESLGSSQSITGLRIENKDFSELKNTDSLWGLLGMLLLRHNVMIK